MRDGSLYLRLQLEHVYGQILLSDHVSSESKTFIFVHHWELLIVSLLVSSRRRVHEETMAVPLLLAGGVDRVSLSDCTTQVHASRVLFVIGKHTDNTVFALLVSGTKLLSIVQSIRHVRHQISGSV